jgi:hypothetical protein
MMYKVGISKECMDKIISSESFEWPTSLDEFLSKFAIKWTGHNLKEIQELVGRDRATMLVSPRLVIHTDDGPRYPEIGDWIVKVEDDIYIDKLPRKED